MKRSLLAAALVTIGGATWAETPTLTVYTYDSFVSDWGPGPAIEAAFEKTCGCDLAFAGTGDGAALLSRLKLEGARTKADVVLGLDTSLIANAKATELFAPHNGVPADLDLPNGERVGTKALGEMIIREVLQILSTEVGAS